MDANKPGTYAKTWLATRSGSSAISIIRSRRRKFLAFWLQRREVTLASFSDQHTCAQLRRKLAGSNIMVKGVGHKAVAPGLATKTSTSLQGIHHLHSYNVLQIHVIYKEILNKRGILSQLTFTRRRKSTLPSSLSQNPQKVGQGQKNWYAQERSTEAFIMPIWK